MDPPLVVTPSRGQHFAADGSRDNNSVPYDAFVLAWTTVTSAFRDVLGQHSNNKDLRFTPVEESRSKDGAFSGMYVTMSGVRHAEHDAISEARIRSGFPEMRIIEDEATDGTKKRYLHVPQTALVAFADSKNNTASTSASAAVPVHGFARFFLVCMFVVLVAIFVGLNATSWTDKKDYFYELFPSMRGLLRKYLV